MLSWSNRPTERIPSGVKFEQRRGHAISSIYVPGVGKFAEGRPHDNTFKVVAHHEKLARESGVKFNVETVPKALEQDMKKINLSREDVAGRAKEEAAAFYDNRTGFQPKDIRLEAATEPPETLVFAGGSGFLAACLTAFAQHLPLALAPDHVWSVIAFAFAKHVDVNAEELRKHFVQHEGKKRLEVDADHMVMSGGDPGSGSSPREWEESVFSDFSRQIKSSIGEKVHSAIAADFSTTTSATRAAHEITLMSAMKNYFSFGMRTACGIPSITLLGSEEDWVSLRARAEKLGKLMMPEFSEMWMPALLPVLDEFVQSYKGNVNHGFWQSMVKLRNTGGGSGSYSFISGWVQILFPYLKSGRMNLNLKPWQQAYFSGPEPEDFPSIVSSAPVDWNYFGATFNLHFHAGITGCTQDPSDGTLTPVVGWYVSHDPPQQPDARLEEVKAEIAALLKGHADEAQVEPSNKCEAWYRRVRVLHLEQQSLEGPARCAPLKRQIEEMRKQRPKYDPEDPKKLEEWHEKNDALNKQLREIEMA